MIAHLIDIDNCVFRFNRNVWIIDKKHPNKPIMTITEEEFNIIKSGVFEGNGHQIDFNGNKFWVSEKFFNLLKVKAKNNDIAIGELGISIQEFLNKELIDQLDVDINMGIFNDIKDKEGEILLIISKVTADKYQTHIKKLEEKLENIGLKTTQYFYINRTIYEQTKDLNAWKKSLIVSRLLTGYVPDGNIFTNQTNKTYDVVNYYDTDYPSLETIKDIQNSIDIMWMGSDEVLKETIKKEIKNKKVNIIECSSNQLNPYIMTTVNLSQPKIIMTFENFKNTNYDILYFTFIRKMLEERFDSETLADNVVNIKSELPGDDPIHSYFNYMPHNNVVYGKIWDKIAYLYNRIPPKEFIPLPPKVNRIAGYRNSNFIKLMEYYKDYLFNEESWMLYLGVLKTTIKKGNKGEDLFKKYLSSKNISYELPTREQDKEGIDIIVDGKKMQIKTCDSVKFDGDLIYYDGKLDINFKHIRNVDFLILYDIKMNKMYTISTNNIYFNPKEKNIKGKLLKIINF
jgi:hypothetical protein